MPELVVGENGGAGPMSIMEAPKMDMGPPMSRSGSRDNGHGKSDVWRLILHVAYKELKRVRKRESSA